MAIRCAWHLHLTARHVAVCGMEHVSDMRFCQLFFFLTGTGGAIPYWNLLAKKQKRLCKKKGREEQPEKYILYASFDILRSRSSGTWG